MDSKIVNKEIKARVWPLLKNIGFSRFTSRSAWRFCDKKIDVLNFQSFNAYNAHIMGVTTFSFCVNIGSLLNYVPLRSRLKVKDGQQMPDEFNCHFRGRLKPTTISRHEGSADIWKVDEQGRNLLWCMQDVAEQIPNLEAWFSRLDNISEVLSILLNQEEEMSRLWGFGQNPSPIRSYLTGYVALAAGKNDLAREKLEEAVQSDCFSANLDDLSSAIRRAT